MGCEGAMSRRRLIRTACFSMLWAEEPAVHGISALLDGEGLIQVPAGEFQMGFDGGYGDEKPGHRVRITRAFELGKYEVTQEQWRAVMSEAHPRPGVNADNAPSRFKGAALPVESVSWNDVQVFLARLNGRSQEYRFRLPTEAEWEYASVAGKGASERGAIGDRAWFKENSGEETHAVGQKQANAFGLHDLDGNVAEWVNDWYGFDYYADSPVDDPQGPETGSYRVFRGGCWFDEERACRASARRFDFPINQFHNVGFRVVRERKLGV